MAPTFSCGICLETCESSKYYPAGNGKICPQCAQESAVPQFQKAVKFECEYPVPGDGTTNLDPADFVDLLPSGFMACWKDKLKEYDTPIQQRLYCRGELDPTGGLDPRLLEELFGETVSAETEGKELCGNFLGRRSTENDTTLRCSKCGNLVCSQCCAPHAHGHSCEAQTRDAATEASDNLSTQVRGRDYQVCPNSLCGATIYRSEGCNEILCPILSCSANFCFICGLQTDPHSDHWATTCPRYSQPDEEDAEYDESFQPEALYLLRREEQVMPAALQESLETLLQHVVWNRDLNESREPDRMILIVSREMVRTMRWFYHSVHMMAPNELDDHDVPFYKAAIEVARDELAATEADVLGLVVQYGQDTLPPMLMAALETYRTEHTSFVDHLRRVLREYEALAPLIDSEDDGGDAENEGGRSEHRTIERPMSAGDGSAESEDGSFQHSIEDISMSADDGNAQGEDESSEHGNQDISMSDEEGLANDSESMASDPTVAELTESAEPVIAPSHSTSVHQHGNRTWVKGAREALEIDQYDGFKRIGISGSQVNEMLDALLDAYVEEMTGRAEASGTVDFALDVSLGLRFFFTPDFQLETLDTMEDVADIEFAVSTSESTQHQIEETAERMGMRRPRAQWIATPPLVAALQMYRKVHKEYSRQARAKVAEARQRLQSLRLQSFARSGLHRA